MHKFLLVAVMAAAILATQAHAGTRDPGVNKRQANQQHRINKGIRSGQLTRPEARELRLQQRAIRLEERAFKADGELTRAERRELHRDLNAASRNIYQEKHDQQTRR